MYNKSVKEIEKIFNVDSKVGISSIKAKELLAINGKNRIEDGKKKSIWKSIWDQFNDPMIFILVLAAIISGITADISDSVVIAIVIILNAAIGVIQEIRAEKSMEALKKLSSPRVYVRRDNKVIEIDSEDVVVGDVIILDAGRYIPCDMRIIESANLYVEESSLTGESVPVLKISDTIDSDKIVIGDQKNLAFASTLVTSGRGEGIAIRTGMDTEIGKIANMLDKNEEATPLQIKLAEIGKILGIIALSICALMFIIGIVQQRDIIEMLLLAISLAVAAVPEGMPAIVSIVLAMGIRRMVKHNAIIRKLPAVETLGSVSVICSDKTGTLTQNKMTVTEYCIDGKRFSSKDIDTTIPQHLLMLEGMALCSDATENTGDPTEIALITVAKNNGIIKSDIDNLYKRTAELAFDSDRKMMTTVHDYKQGSISFTKGAIDNIVNHCTKIMKDNRVVDITEDDINNILDNAKQLSSEALRVLALAYGDDTNLEKDLTFVGMLGMIDPPRLEVKESIKTCKQSGIKTVMITGDHKITALAIARELDIAHDESECMSGIELEEISDEELTRRINHIRVFARVSPEHKVRIVSAFTKAGNIVSMTGDGVNDAPSLKAANIGVAMGITGTDVAKNAADMTLMDDNFSTIVRAVEEGRQIYTNIRKAIFYLLSCNIGEIFAILMSVIAGFPTPLQSVHLLWVNLVTDTSPALALGVDPQDSDVMKHNPRNPKDSFFKGKVGFLIFHGFLIGSITLIAFIIGIKTYTGNILGDHSIIDLMALVNDGVVNAHDALIEDGLVHAQTMAFMVLSISQLFHSFNLRADKKSIFKVGLFKNKWLVLSFIFGLTLQISIIYIPWIADKFHVHAINLFDWIIIFSLSILPVLIYELFKLFKNLVIKK